MFRLCRSVLSLALRQCKSETHTGYRPADFLHRCTGNDLEDILDSDNHLYKFRIRVANDDEEQKKIEAVNQADGPVFLK